MMTPSVVTLQEVLRHHRTLSRGREFYESLLEQGDVLAVRPDYPPGAMIWLVTSHAGPADAQGPRRPIHLRRVRDEPPGAQDLFGAVGDPTPATSTRSPPGSWPPRPTTSPPAPTTTSSSEISPKISSALARLAPPAAVLA